VDGRRRFVVYCSRFVVPMCGEASVSMGVGRSFIPSAIRVTASTRMLGRVVVGTFSQESGRVSVGFFNRDTFARAVLLRVEGTELP
jgi:hypothetical protein